MSTRFTLHNDTVFFFIITLGLFLISYLVTWERLTVGTCKHYATQASAQKDIKKYPRLDHDHNGLACSSYFK